MRVIGLLCLLLLLPANNSLQSPVCLPDVPEEVVGWIADWIGELAFSQACNDHATCASEYPGQEAYCVVPVYEAIVEACVDTEQLCEFKASYATAVLLQNYFNDEILVLLADPVVTASVSLTAHKDALLEIAARRTFSDRSDQSLLYLAVGAAHEFAGDTTAAEAIYTQGLSSQDDPLLLYRRGLLYGSQGQAELAALDGFLLNSLATSQPNLDGIATRITSLYPLDVSRLEDWKIYEEFQVGHGVGGSLVSDESTTPPRSARLGRYANDTALLVIEETISFGTFIDVYQQISPNTYHSPANHYLTFMGDTALRSQHAQVFEAESYYYDRLAKAEIPDPRPDYPRCENGARWFLKIGDEAYFVERYDQESILYDSPGGQVADAYLFELMVVDGPVCVESTAWWGVRDAGDTTASVYWLPEIEMTGTGFTYDVFTQTYRNTFCAGVPFTDLSVNTIGYVLQDADPVTLYADPNLISPALNTLAPGETFTTGIDYTCFENVIWWHVDYSGLQGWLPDDDRIARYIP
jgi:hypothetical protein